MKKDINRPSSAADVINALNELSRDRLYIFRGYNKHEELYPSLIRGDTRLEDEEFHLLSEFEYHGSQYFSANSVFDFISTAQHFGLPTRLLDFTYNPFIALSFALYEIKSNGKYSDPNDRDYYHIRYAELSQNMIVRSFPIDNQNQTIHDSIAEKCKNMITQVDEAYQKKEIKELLNNCIFEHELSYRQKAKIARKIENLEAILLVDPNQSNQRMIMQQGLFMIPCSLERNLHERAIESSTQVIDIHKNYREDLLMYLDTLGYTSFRLMPDIVSVCHAVKQQVKNNRKESGVAFKSEKPNEKEKRFLEALQPNEMRMLIDMPYDEWSTKLQSLVSGFKFINYDTYNLSERIKKILIEELKKR